MSLLRTTFTLNGRGALAARAPPPPRGLLARALFARLAVAVERLARFAALRPPFLGLGLGLALAAAGREGLTLCPFFAVERVDEARLLRFDLPDVRFAAMFPRARELNREPTIGSTLRVVLLVALASGCRPRDLPPRSEVPPRERAVASDPDPLWMLKAPPPAADARLRYGEGEHHFGDLRLPRGAGPFPVVVVIHGGFWRARYDLEHAGHLAADLARRGYATWSIEYRRIGHPGGGVPGTLEDVGLAVDHLRTFAGAHRLDLSRVVVLGHSAGGHLAAWAASRAGLADTALRGEHPLPLRGAVLLAGVLDLEEAHRLRLGEGVVEDFVGASPSARPDLYALASPLRRVPLGVPQVLLHGAADDVVPPQLSARYAEAARRAGDAVTLIALEGAGHFELIDPRAAEWEQVVQAVRTLLGADGP